MAAVDFFPLLLLIVPALYVDLIRGGVNRRIREYMEANGLQDPEEDEAEPLPETKELSATELDRMLDADADQRGEGKS